MFRGMLLMHGLSGQLMPQLKQFRGFEEKALHFLWLLLAFNVICTLWAVSSDQ